MSSEELAAALRLIAQADPSAFADSDHMRSLLLDVAPDLSEAQVDLCVQAVRYRLPDLLRSSVNQPVDHITGLLASRMGLLDAAPYYDVVTAFAGALGTAVTAKTPTPPDVETELHQQTVQPAAPPPQMPPAPQPPMPPSAQQQIPSHLQPHPSVPSATETVLSAPKSTVRRGAPLTLNAFVRSGFGVPAGSVLFLEGGAQLAAVPVEMGSGRADFTTDSAPQGDHYLHAQFQPYDAGRFLPSQSVPVPVRVVEGGGSRKKLIAASVAGVLVLAGGVVAAVLLATGGSGKPKPPPPPPLLAAPPGLHTQVSSTAITLSWNAVPGATSYKVFRDGKPLTPNQTVSPTEVRDTSASTSTTHVYFVKAADRHGRLGHPSARVTSPTRTDAANALSAMVPSALAQSGNCIADATGEKQWSAYGITEVECTPLARVGVVPKRMFVDQYPTSADLAKFMTDHTGDIKPTGNSRICDTASTSDIGVWFKYGTKTEAGKFYCFESNNISVIAWTYPKQNVRIQVELDNGPISDLNSWWNSAWNDRALDLGS